MVSGVTDFLLLSGFDSILGGNWVSKLLVLTILLYGFGRKILGQISFTRRSIQTEVPPSVQDWSYPPSKGPYVLVATEHPGAGLVGSYPYTFPTDLKNFQVLELNGADASEIMRLLTDLADKLVAGDLTKLNPNSENYWRAWQRSFEGVCNTLVGLSKKVTLKIKTLFFETEIKF